MSIHDIAIVDLSAIWYQMWHGTASKPLDESQKNTLGKIRRIASRHQHCVVALDRPPYDRRKDFPAYKAQRDDDTEQMKGQRADTIAELRAEGFCLLEHPGCEADDMIASCVAALAAVAERDFREHGDAYQITVYSADKDLLALRSVADAEAGGPLPCQVRIVSTEGNCDKERMPEDKWGITAEQVPQLLAIAGDTADHIPGIRGVSDGRAAKLINAGLDVPALVELVSEKKAFEISAKLPEGMGEACAAAIIEAVTTTVEVDGEKMSALERDLQLTTLRTDAPVDIDCVFAPREPVAASGGDENYGFSVDAENYGAGGEPEPDIASVEATELQDTVPPSEEPEPETRIDVPPAVPTQPSQREPEPAAVQLAPVDQHPMNKKLKRRPLEPHPMEASVVTDTGTAMVVHDAEWAFEPANRDEAWGMAKMVRETRLFASFGGSREKIMLALMAGRQRGMSVIDSLNGFFVIEGRVAPLAQVMFAWCLNDPVCEQMEVMFEESTDEIGVVMVKRRGWSKAQRVTFTIEEAKDAGLTSKANWRYAKDMLINRALTRACHFAFPDVTRGINTAEELEGIAT